MLNIFPARVLVKLCFQGVYRYGNSKGFGLNKLKFSVEEEELLFVRCRRGLSDGAVIRAEHNGYSSKNALAEISFEVTWVATCSHFANDHLTIETCQKAA